LFVLGKASYCGEVSYSLLLHFLINMEVWTEIENLKEDLKQIKKHLNILPSYNRFCSKCGQKIKHKGGNNDRSKRTH